MHRIERVGEKEVINKNHRRCIPFPLCSTTGYPLVLTRSGCLRLVAILLALSCKLLYQL